MMFKKHFFNFSLFTLVLCSTSAFSAGYDDEEYSEVVQTILLTTPDGFSDYDHLSSYLEQNFDYFSENERSEIFRTLHSLDQQHHPSYYPVYQNTDTYDDFKIAQEFLASDLQEEYKRQQKQSEEDHLFAQQLQERDSAPRVNVHDDTHDDFKIAQSMAALDLQEEYKRQQKQSEEDHLFAQQLQERDSAPRGNFYGYPVLKENPEFKERFKGIHAHLKNITQHADVHVLDDYVFGAQKTITTLLEIGRFYELGDKGDMTLGQVGAAMVEFVNESKDFQYFFENYRYEDQTINKDRVIEIIQSHFGNMDQEIVPVCAEARELWSRTWTLSQVLFNQRDDLSVMQKLFDEVIEGHLTNGGCVQGRINRGFVGYVSLLGQAGVGSYL